MPETTYEVVQEVFTKVQKVLESGHAVLIQLDADASLSEIDLAYLCGQYLALGAVISRAKSSVDFFKSGV